MVDEAQVPGQLVLALPDAGMAAGPASSSQESGEYVRSLQGQAQVGRGGPRSGNTERPGTHGPDGAVQNVSQREDSVRPPSSPPVFGGSGPEATELVTPADLRDFFRCNPNGYAVETKTGWAVVREYLRTKDYEQHLAGNVTLGIFPVYGESAAVFTSFVCFDIDSRDLGPVYALTGALDPHPYVVEDTGGRGRHVWVFFIRPVGAALARKWAAAVVEAAGVKCEVYPKQDSLPSGHLGNLIRLPFGVNRRTGERSRVLFGEFKTLDRVPSLAVPSKTQARSGADDGWLSAMWDGDSTPSGGRNNTLNRFHWWLLRRGFPAEVARELCEKVNDGFHPPLDEAEFAKVVRERRDI